MIEIVFTLSSIEIRTGVLMVMLTNGSALHVGFGVFRSETKQFRGKIGVLDVSY